MQQNGFTIFEALVGLGIICIVTLFALPSFSNMLARNQTTTEVNRLVGAVNLTRHTAVQYSTTATLCGVKTNGKCGAPWHEQLTVFLDRNKNARLDSGEETVSIIHPLGNDGTVKWRAFQNRQYLQLTANGYTNYQNGNFVICPPDADVQHAKQLVINVQGRARVNHSINEDGFPVDRKGKVLRC